jgi:hypothetical protein
MERFAPARMIDAYEEVYARLASIQYGAAEFRRWDAQRRADSALTFGTGL